MGAAADEGKPQGASISTLLANVYLHYVFDQWAHQWRRQHARGDMIVVRYADDILAGFEHQDDAQRFLADLRERFAKFALELNTEKTRLIEFGRFAAANRARRGLGKPETFDFLGFTHMCSKSRAGYFKLTCITSKKRMRAKLREVKTSLKRRRHLPIPDQGARLGKRGARALRLLRRARNQPGDQGLRYRAIGLWRRALRRRSQRTRLTWKRMYRVATRWIPTVGILHPWPTVRFDAKTQGRSPVR